MPWYVVLALFVASFILQALLVKTVHNDPATLGDFDFPQADEGTPQGVVFGDVWTGGWFVAWYGNLRTKAVDSGKK